ncbi:MAG: hypothetical protein RI601_12305 [Desulfurivibrionaceae bacterium]|nr:hypothetical protein [Desulfurivibrionaceae bacterium]
MITIYNMLCLFSIPFLKNCGQARAAMETSPPCYAGDCLPKKSLPFLSAQKGGAAGVNTLSYPGGEKEFFMPLLA